MTCEQVTAIVVNWRLKEETVRCIRSLTDGGKAHRVIVIDNGSGDGSAEYIARHLPAVDLLALPRNVGFGAACNRAIVRALQDHACEFVFLLNNDATMSPAALSAIVEAARANPRAGILGAKTYYWDRPRTIWYAGARRRRAVLAACDTGRGQVDRGQFDALRPVDYVFGTAMLVRRAVFESIGLFDEQFFLYLEDLDLCLRARAAGFDLLFVPKSHVWHRGSASTAQNSALRTYHLVRSTLFFLHKHGSLLSVPPLVVFWGLVSLRAMAGDIARSGVTAIRPYGRGLVDGVRDLVQRQSAARQMAAREQADLCEPGIENRVFTSSVSDSRWG